MCDDAEHDAQHSHGDNDAGRLDTTDTPDTVTSDDNDMTLEDYKQALSKARHEAAKYRTQRNELRPLAEKYREMEEANKTEAEKQAERIQQLEAENQAMKLETLRTAVGQKYNLDPGLLRGTTEDELTEHAEAIRTMVDAAIHEAAKNTPFAPTVPGDHPGGAETTTNDWLRNKLRGL